jgi:CheY-like chemotaxis protein
MSIWSIWFNQTNETDQINERDQLQRGQWMAQRMPQDRKSAVILIAEDDREMRSLLCDELYDLGVSIREAADGDEALRSVLDTCPTLILTDLRMPAGGLDYISRLRTFAPGVPIVLLTSFGDSKTKADALAIGVEAYFDKPVRLSELKGAVQRLLGTALDGEVDGDI